MVPALPCRSFCDLKNDEIKLPPSPSRLQRLAMAGQANDKIFTLLNNRQSMYLQIIQ
jgi:hypothetical protein